jgi:hypothetical protein
MVPPGFAFGIGAAGVGAVPFVSITIAWCSVDGPLPLSRLPAFFVHPAAASPTARPHTTHALI